MQRMYNNNNNNKLHFWWWYINIWIKYQTYIQGSSKLVPISGSQMHNHLNHLLPAFWLFYYNYIEMIIHIAILLNQCIFVYQLVTIEIVCNKHQLFSWYNISNYGTVMDKNQHTLLFFKWCFFIVVSNCLLQFFLSWPDSTVDITWILDTFFNCKAA